MMRITFEKLHVENEMEHLEKLINGIEVADRVLCFVWATEENWTKMNLSILW